MQVMDSIEFWCKRQNKQQNAPLYIACFAGGVIASMAAVLEHNLIYGLLGGALLVFWLFFVPPFLSVKRYMSITNFGPGYSPIMPDSLLSHLADDPEIPVSAKQVIASKLATDGQIDFRCLAEVDADLRHDAARSTRMNQEGAQKMSAYNSVEQPRQQGNGRPTPKSWGLPDDVVFRVTRGGQTSLTPCAFDEMVDYLEASGFDLSRDEMQVAAIIAGVPFEMDGATMRFEQVRTNEARIDWAMHAHPLKQIRITLQGTRHSEPESMLNQLDEIVSRIKQGDTDGESADDDFGYKFSVDLQSSNPSVFGNAPAK